MSNPVLFPLWRCQWIGADGTSGSMHGRIGEILNAALARGAISVSICVGDLRKDRPVDLSEVSRGIGGATIDALVNELGLKFDDYDRQVLALFKQPTDEEVLEELLEGLTGKDHPGTDLNNALETLRVLRAIQIIKERQNEIS